MSMAPSKALLLLLLAAGPAAAEAPRVVALDAGHGGRDRGAVVRGVEENALALTIAQKAAEELKKVQSLSPYLTRWEDVFVPLSERVDRAEEAGGRAFVSIHADKVYGRKPRGVIVWVFGHNKEIPKGPSREPGERMRPAPPKEVVAQSRLLAEHVQGALRRQKVKTASYADRGGFAVLKSDKMPSILVEVGNLVDPAEAKQMQDPAFQDRVAKAIAQGVLAYFAGAAEREARVSVAR